MVAAKSLLATALLALTVTASALADSPTVRISSAGQRMAVGALLHLSDLGAGWQGGETRPSPLSQPGCPGFDPRESGLVVNGHADARYTYAPGGVVLSLDVEVLSTPAAVRSDFARTITPALRGCLGYQLSHSANVARVAVERMRFPPPQGGGVSAAYRATVMVHGSASRGLVLSDYIYFGVGRTEYSLNVIAPVSAQAELGGFEFALARKLLERARLATA